MTSFVRKVEGPLDPKIQPVLFVKTMLVAKTLAPLLPIVQPHLTLEHQLDEIRSMSKMSGKSPKIKEVFVLIEKLAKSTSNVLLLGESGTGKEMVAVAIHEQSERNQKLFVAINCSSIPAQLLESELFGHKKGSFTGAQEARRGLFEEANGGTIFLDEIGDMPLELQSKLLRVIQEREITPVGENKPRPIDVRIIAATHKDLEQMVADGKFRQDLFYRLSVVPIRLPALRDRKEDIVLLAEHFLEKYCAKNRVAPKRFTAAAIDKLLEQDWPGNVRELENSIERAVVLSDTPVIDEGEILDAQTIEKQKDTVGIFAKLMTLEEMEKCYILYVLAHTAEHKDKAAKILGIDRKTLYRREAAYGLVPHAEL
jgi:DNA-binding NtrC family response regulator